MKKRFKTDYFEKLNQLTEICCNNIATAKKIISSAHSVSDNNQSTGNKIFREIKASLEKDFFAPFEREDIFILSAKLNELSENTKLLCIHSNKIDIFSVTSDLKAMTGCLRDIVDNIRTIIIMLAKYPKHSDLTDYFRKCEALLTDFRILAVNKDKHNPLIQITEDCAENCKEIILLIQYTLIKNS